jgi:hypothetical protein
MFVAELRSILIPQYLLESVMGSPSDFRFLRRAYKDGKFESICKECFHTIAKGKCEADLYLLEIAHICDPWTRSRLWQRAINNYFGP